MRLKYPSMLKTPSLIDRARDVATLADKHSQWGDQHGQLAEPVVEALHREGLFGMWVPRTVRGGAELDPVSSLQVIENLAYGDPSAGWVLMAAALAIGTGAAYLGDDGGRGAVRRRRGCRSSPGRARARARPCRTTAASC